MLELDHPEFNLSDMEGLRIVMQAYRAATVVREGGVEEGGGIVCIGVLTVLASDIMLLFMCSALSHMSVT